MIRIRLAGAVAAGSLAIGLVAGSAGPIVARDDPPTQAPVAACIDHMDDMRSFMSGQGGMMSGQGGMMSGQGGMMSGAGPTR